MTKFFTFCPNLSTSTTLLEDINSNDFFVDLFEAHWEILGFQIAFLVVTFVLILPLTFCFIEVNEISQLVDYLILFEFLISRVLLIV